MAYLVRRIGFYMVAFWASLTINFFIPRLMPGDPGQALLARLEQQGSIDPAQESVIAADYGISHDSVWNQYWHYLSNLLHGDLGVSISYFPTPVADIIRQDLPWTLVLVGVSLVVSVVLGTALGAIISWRRGTWLDGVLPSLTLLSAIPYFWLALIFLYVLGFKLNWFPINGGYDTNITPGPTLDFLASAIQHAILPALTIVASSIVGWVLTMRNSMITTLSEDYVLLAQAKGLPERRVLVAYAGRNAILPTITGFALALGFIVGGSLLTEIVFSYPGIGYALYTAVQNLDFALLQGVFLMITVAVLVANFLADLFYTLLDPRVRQGGN